MDGKLDTIAAATWQARQTSTITPHAKRPTRSPPMRRAGARVEEQGVKAVGGGRRRVAPQEGRGWATSRAPSCSAEACDVTVRPLDWGAGAAAGPPEVEVGQQAGVVGPLLPVPAGRRRASARRA
jgi:hypothetical protein